MAESLSSQHTANLPDILKELSLSLIVSTYQAGQVIIIREQNGHINTHHTPMERPMGMAHQENRLVIGGAYQLVEYFNMPAASSKVEPVDTHDACYVPRRVHFTGDIDVHEMEYGHNELWLVNTKMSCLCTLDNNYSVVPRWRPMFISAYDLNDRCHLNGLALKDGKPAYVTALGETDTGGGWRSNKADGGLMINVADNQVIARGLSMPHSPRWHMEKLWYLESGNGELATLNLKTGGRETIVELPGFTRGLCFAGRYAFVGLSQVRETSVFAGLPLTQREQNRQCGVWMVDTYQGTVIAFITFTGDVEEIFSVQLLPCRMPALLNLDDPMVRSTYSLPETALKEVAAADPINAIHDQALKAYAEKNFSQAVELFEQILEQKPDFDQARFHLGVTLVNAERWDQAIDVLNQVIAENPKHAEAYNSLGLAYYGKQRWSDALQAFDQSIAADQFFARAQFNRSIVLFKLGDYPAGWRAYEWRWQLPEFIPLRCQQPQWQGEDISDKTLLVYTEQGAGDAIQFVRYLPEVAGRCKKLIVICTDVLRDLFVGINGVDEVRLPGNLPSDLFDVYCPIMSLGQILTISLTNPGDRFPYLVLPSHISVPELENTGNKKVGLCWRGSAGHKKNHHRSCPLEVMLNLTRVADVDFYGFNIDLNQQEQKLLADNHVTDLDHKLTGFARTAAYLKQLDLIITVDTVTAHLAGAFNIPTWVLLNTNPDWRWNLEGDTTVWYPSVRLFRLVKEDDWRELIARIKSILSHRRI